MWYGSMDITGYTNHVSSNPSGKPWMLMLLRDGLWKQLSDKSPTHSHRAVTRMICAGREYKYNVGVVDMHKHKGYDYAMLHPFSHNLILESFNFLVEPADHDATKPYFIYIYNQQAYHIGQTINSDQDMVSALQVIHLGGPDSDFHSEPFRKIRNEVNIYWENIKRYFGNSDNLKWIVD